MTDLVGVKTALDLFLGDSFLASLKRDALLLGRIGIPNLKNIVSSHDIAPPGLHETINEMRWLSEQGVLFETPDILSMQQPILGGVFEEQVNELRRLVNLVENTPTPVLGVSQAGEFADNAANLLKIAILQARLAAVYLREREGIDASPWGAFAPAMLSSTNPNALAPRNFETVLKVVLNNLPIPDGQTHWERILEFRSDTESRSKFLALRNWMREISRLSLPQYEIDEKLEYLLDDYENHLKRAGITCNTGRLETLIVPTAELIGNLAGFKWGEAAKMLFSLKKQEIALMETERNSPGREIAFILASKKAFGN